MRKINVDWGAINGHSSVYEASSSTRDKQQTRFSIYEEIWDGKKRGKIKLTPKKSIHWFTIFLRRVLFLEQPKRDTKPSPITTHQPSSQPASDCVHKGGIMTKTTDDFIYSRSYSAKFITVARWISLESKRTFFFLRPRRSNQKNWQLCISVRMLCRTCFVVTLALISAIICSPLPQAPTSESPGDWLFR